MLEDCSVALLRPAQFSLLAANQTPQRRHDDNVHRSGNEEGFASLLDVVLRQSVVAIPVFDPGIERLAKKALPRKNHEQGRDKRQTSEEQHEAEIASFLHFTRRSFVSVQAPLGSSSTGSSRLRLSYR